MQVRCPNCRAHYDIDSSLASSGPVRLQCAKCGKTFKLQLASAPEKEKTTEWKIRRRVDGEVLTLDGLPTLQRWIVERRVLPEDEISRTGQQWKVLGSITELSSFFAIIEQLDLAAHDLPNANGKDVTTVANSAAHAAADDAEGDTAAGAVNPFASLGDSIEEALEAQFGEDPPTQNDSLTEALLASLSQEPERRPISEIQDADALRELLSQPTRGIDAAALSSEPELEVILDETIIEIPRGIPLTPAPIVDDARTPGGGWFAEESNTAATKQPASPLDLGAEHDAKTDVTALVARDTLPRSNLASVVLITVVLGLVGLAIAFIVLSPEEPADANTSVSNTATTKKTTETPRANASQEDTETAPIAAVKDETPNENTPNAPTVPKNMPGLMAQSVAHSVVYGIAQARTDEAAVTADNATPVPTPSADSSATPSTPGRTSVSTLIKRGDKARERGSIGEAVGHYERALDMKSSSAPAAAGLGWCYLSTGGSAAAIKYFDKAIAANSGYEKAYIGLAKAYQKAGTPQRALETYERYLTRFPSGSQVTIAQAQSKRLRTKLEEKKAAEKPPTPPPGKKPENAGDAKKDDKESKPAADPFDTSTDPTAPSDNGKKIIIIKKN